MNKVLRIDMNQPSGVYLEPCLMLSMLLPCDINHLWYMSHFVQLCAWSYIKGDLIYNNGYVKVYFEDTRPDLLRDLFLYSALSEELVHKEKNMASYIIQAINDSKYCIVDVDEYYIPGTYYANRVHYYRKMLIYGYDDIKERFYAASQDQMTVYRPFELTFDMVNYLLHLPKSNQMNVNYGGNPIAFYKPILNNNMYIDHEVAVMQLTNSIIKYCKNEHLRPVFKCTNKIRAEFYYGTDLYEPVIKSLLMRFDNLEKIDYRSFRIMLEHKICLEARLRYLQESKGGDWLNDEILIYQELQKRLKEVIYLFLRPYRKNMKKKKRAIYDMSQTLTDLRVLEQKAMEQLLNKFTGSKC